MKRILNIIIIILLSAICLTGTAQKIAVKSNLLGWATATPTLGAEIGLDDRWTLNTHIYYNPFTFRDNRKWKHIRVQPEVRYWLCQKFNGHFFGLHVLYTHFNAGQVPLPFGIFPDVKKYRYQGNTYGAGLSYGYQWILTPRWSIEGSIGVGYKYNTFVFSSIVYIYLFLCYCLPTMNKYLRIWVALVVALNPVVINQMCTYYIDWTLYTLLVIFLINMYLFFVKGIQRALHIDLLLLFFIPAIKFNIFFWVVLWGGICFFALLRKSRYKHSFRLTAVCTVVVLLGIGVGAYNPYLTNWKEHGSPVYPLSGNGKVDIMDCQVLPAIRGKSNAEAALISVASNPSDDMLSEDIHVFGISKIDILSSVASDVRIGGFGIFFFEAILLSIVLFVCTGHIRRMRWYLSVLVGLLVSLVILPSGWWARYVAFFYLFPFVMLFYAERFGLKTRFSRGLHILILSLLSADIFICLSGLAVKNIVYKETIDYVLEKMESSPGEAKLYTRNYSFLDKLERRSIPYKLFPDTEMKDKLDIPCPIYMNRTDFDFETDQPWILSLRPSFQLKWSDNNRYEGQDE